MHDHDAGHTPTQGSAQDTFRVPRERVRWLFLVFALLIGLVLVRIFIVQVVNSASYSEEAVAERTSAASIAARRGDILDVRGVPLATSAPAGRIAAINDLVLDKPGTAHQLAPLVKRDEAELLAALEDPELEWTLLARQLDPATTEQIRALALPGIEVDTEPSRIYPFGNFAAHVLGFTNAALEGNYGVEGQWDDALAGTPGLVVGERDGSGNLIGLTQSTWGRARGRGHTDADHRQRRAAHDRGDPGRRRQRAACTGRLDHRAGQPHRGHRRHGQPDQLRPQRLQRRPQPRDVPQSVDLGVYEPGSTFKAIVMAIGIDDGVVTPEMTHDDAPGYATLPDGTRIYNFEQSVWGVETMREVLQRSANLGMIFVQQQIGVARLYERLQEFGFGAPTGIDLQGEEQGIVTLPDEPGWNEALPITASFGQGVAVTPLQLVNAFSAIINGGMLMQPYVVASVQDGDDVRETQPTVVRQVLSPESSATMRNMLESVVAHPDSLYPEVDGYRIGAKTGTAQIPSPEGGYIENATIASIVGFGPVEEPRFTVLVKIDWPKKGDTGLEVSGPAMTRVFEQLFRLYGIAPSIDGDSDEPTTEAP
jgi:cell division protein FtsI (penicillin-binding protein 3)